MPARRIMLKTNLVLSNIANYIFQGEFVNTYDDQTFQELRELAQFLIQKAGIQLNCSKCHQTKTIKYTFAICIGTDYAPWSFYLYAAH